MVEEKFESQFLQNYRKNSFCLKYVFLKLRFCLFYDSEKKLFAKQVFFNFGFLHPN